MSTYRYPFLFDAKAITKYLGTILVPSSVIAGDSELCNGVGHLRGEAGNQPAARRQNVPRHQGLREGRPGGGRDISTERPAAGKQFN